VTRSPRSAHGRRRANDGAAHGRRSKQAPEQDLCLNSPERCRGRPTRTSEPARRRAQRSARAGPDRACRVAHPRQDRRRARHVQVLHRSARRRPRAGPATARPPLLSQGRRPGPCHCCGPRCPTSSPAPRSPGVTPASPLTGTNPGPGVTPVSSPRAPAAVGVTLVTAGVTPASPKDPVKIHPSPPRASAPSPAVPAGVGRDLSTGSRTTRPWTDRPRQP
jgi:hypothetical protein